VKTRRFLIIVILPFQTNELSGHRFPQKIPAFFKMGTDVALKNLCKPMTMAGWEIFPWLRQRC
jgi:hypothetical protein